MDHLVEIRVPGDKSISHRALILSTLARGKSTLRGLLTGDDVQRTAAALRALGAEIPEFERHEESIVIEGKGLDSLDTPEGPIEMIDCGNSGTTARLLLGLLAGSQATATLTGDDSLRSRPMRRVTDPLEGVGARFEELGSEDRLPIRVHGSSLDPITYESPKASAQIKSALILAGLTAGVRVEVTEPYLSRDHTERMLRAMGVDILTLTGDRERVTIAFEPPEFLEPIEVEIPGDFSSAAYFLALGALASSGGVRIMKVGVNPTRTGLIDAMQEMGAEIEESNGCTICDEPVADLVVHPARLKGIEVGAEEIPAMIDEIPVLAILAARAEGRTVIRGAEELRVKETDRIAALAANLTGLGVEVEEFDDGLAIVGSTEPLRGRIRVYDDHRMAMAFGVLAALPGNEITIDDPAPAAISFPEFWEVLAEVGRKIGL